VRSEEGLVFCRDGGVVVPLVRRFSWTIELRARINSDRNNGGVDVRSLFAFLGCSLSCPQTQKV
jgi:hypothetical protein